MCITSIRSVLHCTSFGTTSTVLVYHMQAMYSTKAKLGIRKARVVPKSIQHMFELALNEHPIMYSKYKGLSLHMNLANKNKNNNKVVI